ncbi:hypothetical protein CCACVL1_22708 [Corchorus capsularis]|uniref:Uncharacterized protein n=1 Tax=Corchorus capsularis TaxID=210143 RepID=A0A1R3GXA3_COCAP|nr:hypothetical protein CCACVL1_22708 [Corchorus capsularis]
MEIGTDSRLLGVVRGGKGSKFISGFD